jgi:hypothetical protein
MPQKVRAHDATTATNAAYPHSTSLYPHPLA